MGRADAAEGTKWCAWSRSWNQARPRCPSRRWRSPFHCVGASTRPATKTASTSACWSYMYFRYVLPVGDSRATRQGNWQKSAPRRRTGCRTGAIKKDVAHMPSSAQEQQSSASASADRAREMPLGPGTGGSTRAQVRPGLPAARTPRDSTGSILDHDTLPQQIASLLRLTIRLKFPASGRPGPAGDRCAITGQWVWGRGSTGSPAGPVRPVRQLLPSSPPSTPMPSLAPRTTTTSYGCARPATA